MQDRRALRLCYNYDEKFIPGHKCSSSRFLLLLIEDKVQEQEAEPTTVEDEESVDITDPEIYFQLSHHAVSGHFSLQTLRFQGLINGLQVMVLIDTCSTHNILQPHIATHLQLPSNMLTSLHFLASTQLLIWHNVLLLKYANYMGFPNP